MNLKGNLTSKGLQGSIGKSRMQGILGTNPAAIPISVDNALSLSSTNPVQNKVITAAITNRLWSDEVKTALLQIVEKVAYVDEHGQDYYDALYNALYPPTNLDSIGAVFDSSATIYNTDTLDDLKPYLTVTAYYTDGTSETVTTYTLSGSMDAGTQTITVSYGGKTTTFSVTVVENSLVSISAVFTQGSAVIYDTDSLDTLKQYLVVTATYADSTTATVSDYTLSGTLTAGTSTISVGYGGETDTFSVIVTTAPVYILPTGTHTFSDGSYVTVSNRNHVKVYCASASDSLTNYGAIWNFLDINDNGTAISSTNNRDNKSLKFTLPNGSTCVWYIKNMTSNTSHGPSIGNRKANGTGTVQSGFGFTGSGTAWETDSSGYVSGDYSSTATASSDLEVGSMWVYVAQAAAFVGLTIEFDVEVYSGTTRYV